MSHLKYLSILIATVVVVVFVSQTVEGVLRKGEAEAQRSYSRGYHECLLKNLKTVASVPAAIGIKQACLGLN